MVVNNTLFEKKHHYMFAMKEIEILKRQMEREALDNEISQYRLDEVNMIWNLIFVGLLREGLAYQYIQNANNPDKDAIRIVVDSVNYECKINIIQKILQDDFEIVLKDILKDLKERENTASGSHPETSKTYKSKNPNAANKKTKENDKPTYEENNSAAKADVEVDDDLFTNDYVNNTDKDAAEISKKENSEFVENTDNLFNNNNAKDNKTEETVFLAKEESMKSNTTMVYDFHLVTVLPPGATEGEEIEVTVVPKKIEKNSSATDIFVIMKNKKQVKYFYSQNTASIVAKFGEDEFLIRGMFNNYEFSSVIMTSGSTAALNCNLNCDTKEYRCKDLSLSNYGHIFYGIKNKEENEIAKAHVIPLLNDENNKNGIADVVIFIERNGEITNAIVNKNAKAMAISLDGNLYQVVNYWSSGYLSSEILANAN